MIKKYFLNSDSQFKEHLDSITVKTTAIYNPQYS